MSTAIIDACKGRNEAAGFVVAARGYELYSVKDTDVSLSVGELSAHVHRKLAAENHRNELALLVWFARRSDAIGPIKDAAIYW